MYLKRVDMENFKSFGGKISIPLMEGYMAITGPNGSGKSNITDAILFVLGPKSSKAMRAGKLTDLIYNGNKASGKADYTKVTLYFENKDRILPWDADEVRFTRLVKVSSDGEGYSSSFYVNDQKSSMAEFDSLLMRARISADGYNMVQQGDVTDITKMGNMERRRIIDSISGISSYDADIAKAQSEKAEAEQNMTLINIVIDELTKQIEQLKKDMESARKYLDTKAHLDMANAQLTYRQLADEEENYNSTKENVQRIKNEIEQLIVKRNELNVVIAETDKAIKQKEQEIAERAGPKYKEIKDKIESVKINKAMAEDVIDREGTDKANHEEELEAQKEALIENQTNLENCLAAVTNAKIELDAKNDALAKAKEESEKASAEMKSIGGEHKELEDKLAALEFKIDSKGNEEHELRSKLTSAQTVDTDSSRSLAATEEKIAALDFEIKDAEWNLQKIKEEAGPAADLKSFTDRIMSMKRQEAELEKQEQDTSNAVRRLSEEYNALAAEKKVSERMDHNEAIIAVRGMRDKGLIKGIHGTVAELATVDKEYELALSIAAGAKLNAVIVDNDEVAAQVINELKRNNFGRVTCLPLNKMMEGKPRAKAILTVNKTLGYAIDLIDFKPEYRSAFWYVFGDTLIVDTMDNARRLMGGIRMVTKGGDLFDASGAMTGGSVKKQAMKFGSASQSKLDEVSDKLRAANGALDLVKSKIIELRNDIREADNQMRTAGAGNIELQGKITKLEVKLGELRDNRKRAKNELETKRSQYTSARSEKESLTVQIDAIVAELNMLKDERTKIRARIAEIAPAGLQQRIQDARDAVYKLTSEQSELINLQATLNAEKSGYENKKAYIENEISKLQRKIETNVKDIAEATDRLASVKIELDALRSIEREMEAGISDLTNVKNELFEKKLKTENERDNAVKDIDTKNAVKSSAEANLNIILKSIEELKQQVAEIKIEVEQPLPSEETLKRTIRSCDNIIKELGNVNLRAIDDYDEKKQRYDTLTEDIDKLKVQIKDLTELTENLSAKKKGLFMEVYDGVNANFKSIFSELSGGGEAYMALENEEDPFQGGLIINAKPKNGKMLRLEALSGGEKSLTALAFIFAIQEHQPSPFYVLDEVDMFLDSVNSEMVAQRIRKSAAKTQFIQVSLRKVTLSLADHLIGVTRPPNGVSKVIMQPDLSEVSKYEEEAQRRIEEAEKKEGAQ